MEFSVILEFWLVPQNGTYGFQVTAHFLGAHFSVYVFYWRLVALQFCVIFCCTEK